MTVSADGADNVYPPSEDTHLLMDVLADERDEFSLRCSGRGTSSLLCVELGIGAGAISQMLIANFGFHVVGVDVNESALRHVARNIGNPQRLDLLRADLVSWARTAPPHLFDIVIFNPPYVPTDADELERARSEHDIAASWAGGVRGREVIDQALKSLRPVLVDSGLFYLLVEHSNDVQDVLKLARENGLRGSVVRSRRAGRESLYVLRLVAV